MSIIKCIALDDITYKDKRYAGGSKVDIDSSDVRNLQLMGAVKVIEEQKKIVRKVEDKIVEEDIDSDEQDDDSDIFGDKPIDTFSGKRKYSRR